MGAMTIEQASQELVDRARLRDQNAVAMLVRVRENAAKGVARAKQAYAAALAYAKSGSVAPKASVGAEPLKRMKTSVCKVKSAPEYLMLVSMAPACPGYAAAEIISRGPKVGQEILSLVGSQFGGEEREAFTYGAAGPLAGVKIALKRARPRYQHALRTGAVLGLAARMQAARMGNIAAISRKAHWELT